MRGYERDDYEDLDEYEEDEEQEEEEVGEEEYEEQEAPPPTREELEYLELRQRLKESIRKQMKKDSGSAISQEKRNKLPSDNYGSFFGPSQPVIAQRVIQESKSLLENQHLAAKVSKSQNGNNKSFASISAGSKPRVNSHPPKVVNELKRKVQKLKDTRDYSFLLSDNAELPVPTKNPPPRNVSVPHSEAQVPPRSKPLSSNNGRQVSNSREERKPMSTGSRLQPKGGSLNLASASKPNQMLVDTRKKLGSNHGNGPGRPLAPKSGPSKTPAVSMDKKIPAPSAKSYSMVGTHRPTSSKLHSSTPKQILEKKRQFQESSKGKLIPKQPVPSVKPQVNRPLPPRISSRTSLQENHPKKKPVRRRYSDDEDGNDDGNAIDLIRRMFGYNPNKYAGRDDGDDSDMEANFDDILKEESRSAKIARMEDEEELRKIEEEERRERLRKEAKRRKLSQR